MRDARGDASPKAVIASHNVARQSSETVMRDAQAMRLPFRRQERGHFVMFKVAFAFSMWMFLCLWREVYELNEPRECVISSTVAMTGRRILLIMNLFVHYAMTSSMPWKAAGKAGQRALVSKKLKNDSLRFSQMQVIIDALPFLTRFGIEAEIRVNDHLDKP